MKYKIEPTEWCGPHHAVARQITQHCLQEGEFTLASGQRSDVYLDLRKLCMFDGGAQLIVGEAVLLVGISIFDACRQASSDVPDFGVRRGFAGVAEGGIPLVSAALVAANVRTYQLDVPPPGLFRGGWIRKQAKDHGGKRGIEGCLKRDDVVVLLEDVFTTGESAKLAIDALREAGMTVIGVIVVCDRRELSEKPPVVLDVPIYALTKLVRTENP